MPQSCGVNVFQMHIRFVYGAFVDVLDVLREFEYSMEMNLGKKKKLFGS
jgi:hypothetical protein